jgi:Histidine kinase-like ATPase domain/MEDS: MEthanogen/methylotroph, DcmR Sensory domain
VHTLVDGATHHALFYRDAAELLAAVVPFLLDGLAEGASVGAALPGPHLELVRSELGASAERVRLFDMTEVGRNPGRILAEVIHAVVDARPDAPARVVDEPVWPGRNGRAVGELAANSIRHGGGRGTVRVWTEPGDDRGLLVVEVADAGRLDDPLAGRRPATPHQRGGRGLLMVHHLADLVRAFSGPGGTTTRTYWRR